MKKILRIYFREIIGLYFAMEVASGLVFQNPIEDFLITALALAVATYLVKPIINILILPLTLATLGLFKFVSHAITLYIVDTAIEGFAVQNFDFPGLHNQYFDLPPVMLNQGPLSYLAFALIISVLTSVLRWVAK